MADGKAEVSIDRSPYEVWKLVREFGGLDEWMPGVESCTVDGDVRTRRISYSVVESPMGNLESHLATIAVDPEGSGSHVTWSVAVVPDDLLALFVPIYEGSVAALKKQIEG